MKKHLYISLSSLFLSFYFALFFFFALDSTSGCCPQAHAYAMRKPLDCCLYLILVSHISIAITAKGLTLSAAHGSYRLLFLLLCIVCPRLNSVLLAMTFYQLFNAAHGP